MTQAAGGSWAPEESRHINVLVMDAMMHVRCCKLLSSKEGFGVDRLDRSLTARAPPVTVNDLSSPPRC